MKGSRVYWFVSRLCFALATVVLLFVAAYVVSALAQVLSPHQVQAADRGGLEEDPLLGFNFALEIEGKTAGYFTDCIGIGSEHNVIEYRVVDEKGHEIIRKIPGRLTWTNVVLRRGITKDMQVWQWRKLVEEGKMAEARANVSIIMLDRNYEEVARWDFANAWPCRISAPGVESGSNEFAVEEIEIVSEGMIRVTVIPKKSLFAIFSGGS